MNNLLFRTLYKNAILILFLTFPLMIITSIFALLTYNLPYKNLLMIILLIGLISILTTIISVKLKYIDYQGVFKEGSRNKSYIVLFVDVIFAVILILDRSIPLSLIILALWFGGAYFIAKRNMLTGNSTIFRKNDEQPKRNRYDDNVIDIDEKGNYKK